MCKALEAGWIPQFEIFQERGLKLGHSEVESDRELFAADNRCRYSELLNRAALGGFDMPKYAFDHGLDCPDWAASHFWKRQALLEIIKRKNLRSLKFLWEKGVRHALNWRDLSAAVSGLVKPPVDRELASEILTALFTTSTDF
ncbi:hypothetical protein ASPCAL13402 [Aspergillus calidoustus]|uniref:Uncharacterized protein n=1 Tax=Aspergillus calidoustus TaxID=454130 RepID=A0A0U5CHL8_ASPCI|nr:hypothetical protein ASPCAL13402 [Aspergillus calidoustus]